MVEEHPRISLAERSLRREISPWPPRHLDLAKIARETFGLEGVEYETSFFPDRATDFGYLADMKKRAEDAGVRSVLVKVAAEGPLGSADESERSSAIESHFKWIAAAAYLRCESVSVAAEGAGAGAPYLDAMADSLWRLGEIADAYGVGVLVGNRVGLACDGSWMAELMKRTAHPRVGTHPNFDNFDLGGRKLYPRYLGVDEMIPWAKALGARSYQFNAAGEETKIDFERMARIAVRADYTGWVGAEYEGSALPEREGIEKTVACIRRAWDRASADR